jgi:hypothetical protein
MRLVNIPTVRVRMINMTRIGSAILDTRGMRLFVIMIPPILISYGVRQNTTDAIAD